MRPGGRQRGKQHASGGAAATTTENQAWELPELALSTDSKPIPMTSLAKIVSAAPEGADGFLRTENATNAALKEGDKLQVFPLRRLADSPGLLQDCGGDEAKHRLAVTLVDVSVRPDNRKTGRDCIGQLSRAVERAGGRLPLTDKSPPQAIRAVLDMSKRQFRSALGYLLSKRRVLVSGGEVVAVGRRQRAQLLEQAASAMDDSESSATDGPTSFPLWPHVGRKSGEQAKLLSAASGRTVSMTKASRLLAERKANRALASEQAAVLLMGGPRELSDTTAAAAATGREEAGSRRKLGQEAAEETAAFIAASKLQRSPSPPKGAIVTVDSDDEGMPTVTVEEESLDPDNVLHAIASSRPERRIRLRSDSPTAGGAVHRASGSPAIAVYDDTEELRAPEDDGEEEEETDDSDDEDDDVDDDHLLSDSDDDALLFVDTDSEDDELRTDDEANESSFSSSSSSLEQQVVRPLSRLSDDEYRKALDPWRFATAGLDDSDPLRARGDAGRRNRATRRALRAAVKAVPPPTERARGQWRRLRESVPQPDLGGGVVPADESDGSDLEYFKRLEGGAIPGRADSTVGELEEEKEEDEGWVALVSHWLELADEARGQGGSAPAVRGLTLRQLRKRARQAVERVELRRGLLVSDAGLRRKSKQARRRVEALLQATASTSPEDRGDK